MKRKILKIIVAAVLLLVCLPVFAVLAMYWAADMGEPVLQVSQPQYALHRDGARVYCGESFLEYDSCGLWELYVEGSGQERGARQGALTKELMRYQEDVFVAQIRRWIPSDRYLGFLRFLIVAFNRDLGRHVPLEYRDEIAGMALFCTHDYDAIGTPYERQLNYHAAHDIGHAMQQYMLVGCSSFGVWGGESASGSLLVGRNFDFYMGEDFARHKMVVFAVPDSGYRYASIAWPGMLGVLSGMNAQGLTVTLNAARGPMPLASATPISILAREILQYAANIEEAYAIAARRKTFVSESILIGSARDHRCAIIEKTPEETVLYEPAGERAVCTNHYQSEALADSKDNRENIAASDSWYRYQRLEELLEDSLPLDYGKAAGILRNRYGLDGEDIGLGNEKALNQFIAHHSVVFEPESHRMWVSTHPWQSGSFSCYDLSAFFLRDSLPRKEAVLRIPADSAFLEKDYFSLQEYRAGLKAIAEARERGGVLPQGFAEAFLSSNPRHYHAYQALGDYYRDKGKKDSARLLYEKSLECEIPWLSDREEIEKQLKRMGR